MRAQMLVVTFAGVKQNNGSIFFFTQDTPCRIADHKNEIISIRVFVSDDVN